MRVANEDAALSGQVLHELHTNPTYAGSGVQDDLVSRIGSYLNTAGVPAVFYGVRTRRGYRTTYAPETNFHARYLV